MRVLVCSAGSPFEGSAQDREAGHLVAALRTCDHEVEIVRLPFAAGVDEAAQHLALRLTGLGHTESVLIALDARSALVDHPHKILWLTAAEPDPELERLAIREAVHTYAATGAASAAAMAGERTVRRLEVPGSAEPWTAVPARLLAR